MRKQNKKPPSKIPRDNSFLKKTFKLKMNSKFFISGMNRQKASTTKMTFYQFYLKLRKS